MFQRDLQSRLVYQFPLNNDPEPSCYKVLHVHTTRAMYSNGGQLDHSHKAFTALCQQYKTVAASSSDDE